MTSEEQWVIARDDAGYTAEQAVWLSLDGQPEGGEEEGTWAASAGPGQTLDSRMIDLDARQREWEQQHLHLTRVYVYDAVPEPVRLGLMRWALEFQRLSRDLERAMTLIAVAHDATRDRIRAGGKGGAAFAHAAPDFRQSDAAGSRLIVDTYGEQFGGGRAFGPLFRRAALPTSDAAFARRAVAFAAFFPDDTRAFFTSNTVSLNSLLQQVHPDGLHWWEDLLDDETFLRLAGAAPAVIPTAEETDAAGVTASALWRTLIDLWDRAEQRALTLLT